VLKLHHTRLASFCVTAQHVRSESGMSECGQGPNGGHCFKNPCQEKIQQPKVHQRYGAVPDQASRGSLSLFLSFSFSLSHSHSLASPSDYRGMAQSVHLSLSLSLTAHPGPWAGREGRWRMSFTEVPGSPRSIMPMIDAGFRVTSTPSTCSSTSPEYKHEQNSDNELLGTMTSLDQAQSSVYDRRQKDALVILGYLRRPNGFCAPNHRAAAAGHTGFRLPVHDH
jgi:hypothetical protein